MNWLLNRLREPSTWRGLIWLATVAGWSLRPEQADAIVTFGITLVGLIGVFLPDSNSALSPRSALPSIAGGSGVEGENIDMIPIEFQSHAENPDLPARRSADRAADPEPERLRVVVPAEHRAERERTEDAPGWNG